jgi:hypothetical protein
MFNRLLSFFSSLRLTVVCLGIAFGGAMVAALGSVVLSLIFWLKEKRA